MSIDNCDNLEGRCKFSCKWQQLKSSSQIFVANYESLKVCPKCVSLIAIILKTIVMCAVNYDDFEGLCKCVLLLGATQKAVVNVCR